MLCTRVLRRSAESEEDILNQDCPVPIDQQPVQELKQLQVNCIWYMMAQNKSLGNNLSSVFCPLEKRSMF